MSNPVRKTGYTLSALVCALLIGVGIGIAQSHTVPEDLRLIAAISLASLGMMVLGAFAFIDSRKAVVLVSARSE